MTSPSPPEPLTLDEVKLNNRVDSSAEDSLFLDLIVDARDYIEGETGLILTPRTVTETAPQLGRWIDLASWPVTNIAAVRYPLAGVMTALPMSGWGVSYARRPVRLVPAVYGWGVGALPTLFPWQKPLLPVEIDVVAGYATPADVPPSAKRAMHLLVAHWYSNRPAAEVGLRAAAIEVPLGVTEIIRRLGSGRI